MKSLERVADSLSRKDQLELSRPSRSEEEPIVPDLYSPVSMKIGHTNYLEVARGRMIDFLA